MPKKSNRTVRCVYCGREFIEPIPHICNNNYRKRKLKWINLMEDNRKRFNVEEFISNEKTPVETRNGKKVIIITTRRNHLLYPIVGDISYNYSCEDEPEDLDLVAWCLNGSYYSDCREDNRDLFFSVKKKTRRMTNQELSFWLIEHPEEHREIYDKGDDTIYSTYSYQKDKASHECPDSIRICYNGGEWKEPLIEE